VRLLRASPHARAARARAARRTFMISPLMKGSSAPASYGRSGSLKDAPATTAEKARGAAALGAAFVSAVSAFVRRVDDIARCEKVGGRVALACACA
jgi:hypothetical protein